MSSANPKMKFASFDERWRFDASVAEVKQEVNVAQEKISQEVARKIGNTMYQFKKKGHKHPYHFNCGVMETITSTHRQICLKLKPENLD